MNRFILISVVILSMLTPVEADIFDELLALYLPDVEDLTVRTAPFNQVFEYNKRIAGKLTNAPGDTQVYTNVPFAYGYLRVLTPDKIVFDSAVNKTLVSPIGKLQIVYGAVPKCPEYAYDMAECIGERYEMISHSQKLSTTINGKNAGDGKISDNGRIVDYAVNTTTLNVNSTLWMAVACDRYELIEWYDCQKLERCRKSWKGVYQDCGEYAVRRAYFIDEISDIREYQVSSLKPRLSIKFPKISNGTMEASIVRIELNTSEPYGKFNIALGGYDLCSHDSGSYNFSYSTRAYDIFYFLDEFIRIKSYPMSRIHDRKFSIAEDKIAEDDSIITRIEFQMSHEDTLKLIKSRACRAEITDLFGNLHDISDLCVIPDLNQTLPESVDVPTKNPINPGFFVGIAGSIMALILTFFGVKKLYKTIK